MIEDLPLYIPISFVLTCLATLFLFFRILQDATLETVRKNKIKIIGGIVSWIFLQGVISFNDLYFSSINTLPPKIFLFGILPCIVFMIWLFNNSAGKAFIDSLPLERITFLNVVRIPIELVLLWLFLENTIPKIMTFEGLNFDILAGISAVFVTFIGFRQGKLNKRVFLVWNIVSLLLLINIIVLAFLSTPSPIQKFGFEQPNIALLKFPFAWLPTFIVPVVLFGHFVSIRRLLICKTKKCIDS